MASIDRRGRLYRARVRIPGFAPKTRSFKTETEAQHWARCTEALLRSGIDAAVDLAAEPTLGEALQWYLERETASKKGAEQEARRVRAWCTRDLARLKLSHLTAQHFIAHKNARLAEGCSGSTVRIELCLISALYKAAKQEWGLPYLENPIASVRKPKSGRGRDRRLTAEEAHRFQKALQACDKEIVRLVIEFALSTAGRQGEILRLRWQDVDLNRRVAVFYETKNGEDRPVALTKEAVAVLKRVGTRDTERVFPTTRTVITRAWRKILKDAEIKNFRFHDLRHEATSALFERGMTTMEVQKITGHKTLSMLLRYTQMDVGHIVQRLDETDGQGPLPDAGSDGQSLAAGADVLTPNPTANAIGSPTTRPKCDPDARCVPHVKGERLPSNVIQFALRRKSK